MKAVHAVPCECRISRCQLHLATDRWKNGRGWYWCQQSY